MLKSLLASALLILFTNSVFATDALKAREQQIENAAQDYESVMIKQVLSQIYENIPVDSISGGGEGEKIFRDLMLTEYSKEIAKSGSIGVAKNLVKDLKAKDSEYQKLLTEAKYAKSN